MKRITALGLAALVAAGPAVGLARADSTPGIGDCDWASFRNGLTNPGASACNGIGAGNVATLRPQALYRTRDSVTSTPAVVDGKVYVGAWDGTFYAFDAAAQGLGDPSLSGTPVATVEPDWTYKIDDTNGVSFGRIVSSPTVTDVVLGSGPTAAPRRLVIFTGGATLYVLDAEDRNGNGEGDLLASICLDPRVPSDTPSGRCQGTTTGEVESEASPVVVPWKDNKLRILVGTDVHNDMKVGRTGVTAVDLHLNDRTLHPEWKFDPEGDGPGDLDGATYTGTGLVTQGSGTGDGCGGVWGTPAVDTASNVVVFGTSSCQVMDGTDLPDPDNVAGEKVWGIDLATGAFQWRFSPPRPWGSRTDDDFGASPQLFTVDGQLLAGAGSKDGWYYALDAADGTEVWKTQVGQPGHANEDFAIGGVLGSPARGQAGETEAIFITTAISTPVGAPVDYGTFDSIDSSLAEDPARMLSLHAVDAATGEILWRSPLTRQTYGHPTYANGLVFVPATAGFSVQAFDAATGVPVWTSTALNGAPSSGVAVTDSQIFFGTGTRQTDAGFKLFGNDSTMPDEIQEQVPPQAEDLVGADPQERLAGIWSFTLG